MSQLLRIVPGCLLVLVALAFAPSAEGRPVPQRTDKHAQFGFSLSVPSQFEARPVPAETPGLVANYAPKDAPLDRRSPLMQSVWRVELGESGRDSAEYTLRRWVLDTLSPLSLEPVRSVKRRFGRDPLRFEGTALTEEGGEEGLFVHAWVGDEDLIVFVGECEPSSLRRERRAFDRTAMSFKFFSQSEEEEARKKWERHYRRTSLKHKERRVDVATAAVDGWAIRDTEHSLILFHGASNSPVLSKIADNLVALRRRFARDFPPDRPIDSLSVVRVCRDRGEYLTYGGNPSTVGYFHPRAQELVLYDARVDSSEEMPDDHQTMRTLYHEACHQYLHHTASSMSPHSWYDEGSAEFYAGATFKGGKVVSILGLDGRETYLRSSDTIQRLPKLETLLSMSQSQFYADADVNYTMGYAFVRFLRSSEAAELREEWSSLPKRYFEALRDTWRGEAEKLALAGLSSAGYQSAVERAREVALKAALAGVDLENLESEFIAWIRRGFAD